MTAVTTRSAAPTNSEGSEDAFSSAQVPYSLPSDRRQKTAKKASYVISTALPTPVRDRCYFECTDSATMPGREQYGWWQSGCRRKVPLDAAKRACANPTPEPAPLFRTKFSDFSKRLPAGRSGHVHIGRRPGLRPKFNAFPPGSSARGDRSVPACGRTGSGIQPAHHDVPDQDRRRHGRHRRSRAGLSRRTHAIR